MAKLNNGGKIRWINTAVFEIMMKNEKPILLDPFLSGEMDGIVCYPLDIDNIESCDYLPLSHIYMNHAADLMR